MVLHTPSAEGRHRRPVKRSPLSPWSLRRSRISSVRNLRTAWMSSIIFYLDYVVVLGHGGDGVGYAPPQFEPLLVCAFVPRAIGTATDGTVKYLRHTLQLCLSSLPPPYGAGSRDRTCSSLRGWSWLSCLVGRLRCRTQSS